MPKIAVIGISGESIFLKTEALPTPSVTTHATNCHIEPGGKGYNQAVACKKLGADVTYLSKVGNDNYGIYCKEYMDKLDISNMFIIDDNNKTAVATILTDKYGENEVIVYPGASSNLTKEDVKLFEDEIKTSDILLIQYEIGLEAVKESIKIAKENNKLIILNPAPAIYFDQDLLDTVDIVTPNFEEAKTLYNIPNDVSLENIGEYLKDKIINTLIITLGSKGCLLIKDGIYKYFGAIKQDAIDTTGAGDIFNAAVASIITSNTLEDAIMFAQASSSISVTRPFVMEAIPTKEEVKKFLQLYNLKEKK